MGRRDKHFEKDLIGRRFGRWTVLYESPKQGTMRMFRCRCDCGNESDVRLYDLLAGKSKRCRHCLKVNVEDKITMTEQGRLRLHRIWSSIISRCYNENNRDYNANGGRGIAVFDGWRRFKNFCEWSYRNGYKEDAERYGQLLDRYDKNSDYNPTNCVWRERKEKTQSNNTHTKSESGYIGVMYSEENNEWISCVKIENELFKIGSYKTQKEAVKARNDFIDSHHLHCNHQWYRGELVIKTKEQEELVKNIKKDYIDPEEMKKIVRIEFLKKSVEFVKALSKRYDLDTDTICDILEWNKKNMKL